MAISFVLDNKKTKKFQDLSDVFITRINTITINAFRLGKVSDLIIKFLTQIMTEQILTEGRRGNTPYPELIRSRSGGGILNKTGVLLEDIKKVKVTKVTKEKQENIRIKLNNTYALFFQVGTKNMVERPILILTQKDKQKLKEIVIESFSKASKNKFN